jgi:hypothetical protein
MPLFGYDLLFFLNQDNEKSYGLNDVVPIIVALERSVHEALGTDFGMYNSKMRHLRCNIKVNVLANESFKHYCFLKEKSLSTQ